MQPEDSKKTPVPPQNIEEKQGLEDIERRVRELREERRKPSKLSMSIKAPPSSALRLAFRVAVELVSALIVGAIIGWSLDQWLDTRPWIMLVFVVLGGAAGVLNVYRLASGFGYATSYQKPEAEGQNHQDSDTKER